MVVMLITLALKTFAQSPFEVWQMLQTRENIPISYEESVISTKPSGISIRHYRVYKKSASDVRREQSCSYSNGVFWIELTIDGTSYMWLKDTPHVYQYPADSFDSWIPLGAGDGYFNGQRILILTLGSKHAPQKIKQYIDPINMLVVKEEFYQKDRLLQVKERQNIKVEPDFTEEMFSLPQGYIVHTKRHSWEGFLVYDFLQKHGISEVYYPKWLPPTWILADINLDDLESAKKIIYRFYDGSELYSLFLSPPSASDKNQSLIFYKEGIGVFQRSKNSHLLTLVGRLREKEAFLILDSLTKVETKAD